MLNSGVRMFEMAEMEPPSHAFGLCLCLYLLPRVTAQRGCADRQMLSNIAYDPERVTPFEDGRPDHKD